MIDPYIVHGDVNVRALRGFLGKVRPVPKTVVRVKTVKNKPERERGNFTEWEQKQVCSDIQKDYPSLGLDIKPVRKDWLGEHDRTIVLRHESGSCYKIILGQGVYGFLSECRSRTEGVWFAISPDEFRKAWDSPR